MADSTDQLPASARVMLALGRPAPEPFTPEEEAAYQADMGHTDRQVADMIERRH